VAAAADFLRNTEFTFYVTKSDTPEYADGNVTFTFNQGDYPSAHPVQITDLAAALTALFTEAGYSTVSPVTGDLPTVLDIPAGE
jgi:hypothetical protein